MSTNDVDSLWNQTTDKTSAEASHVDDMSMPDESDLIAAHSDPAPVQVPSAVPAPPVPAPHLPSVAEVKQQVSDTANQVLSQVKTTAGQAVDQSKQSAGQAVNAAKQQVLQQVAIQKDKAADAIGNFKAPISEISQTFTNHGQPQLSAMSQSLAEQVSNVSDYLRTSDIDAIGRDAQQFAKANPALVIGGAFVLGVLAARFLKSSATATSPDPLLPVVQTKDSGANFPSYGASASDFEAPLPDHAPLTAHGYVDGGVVGGANA